MIFSTQFSNKRNLAGEKGRTTTNRRSLLSGGKNVNEQSEQAVRYCQRSGMKVWSVNRVTILLLLVVIASSLLAGCREMGNEAGAPDGYEQIAAADLSTQGYEETAVATVTLAEAGEVAFYFALENLDTPTFDLTLQGHDGSRLIVLHAEPYRTDRTGSGQWEQELAAGEYELLLSSPESAGHVTIYMRQP
jgi:hypothetical protein